MSSEDNSSRKRPRLSASADSEDTPHRVRTQCLSPLALPEFHQDEEFWYEDGNVVLVAGGIAFRIYRGLLAERSEVFHGLFTLPQPTDAEAVDGCPVVRLSDTAQEVRGMLQAMIRGIRYIDLNLDDIELSTVAAWILMGRKYQMTELQERGIHFLERLFPADFEEWTACVASERSLRYDCVLAVSLARLTDIVMVLPLALYCCCQLSGAQLAEGISRYGTNHRLGLEDQANCIEGRAKLLARDGPMFSRIFSTASRRCKDGARCASLIQAERDDHQERLDGLQDWTDILSPWERSIRSVGGEGLCNACVDMLLRRDWDERRRVWNELPMLMKVEVDNWPRVKGSYPRK